MRKAWLIRPFIANDPIDYTDKFLQGEYIATGPNKIPDMRKNNIASLKMFLVDNHIAEGSYKVGALATVINNFVNKIQEMDLALLISGDDIYAMEITGEYTYSYNMYGGAGFHSHKRKVKYTRRCLRSDLSEELRYALKSSRQVADISRYFNEVYKLVYGKELEEDKKDAAPVEVNYPLRNDFNISFKIPGDMTRDEARRLESFFRNLYFNK